MHIFFVPRNFLEAKNRSNMSDEEPLQNNSGQEQQETTQVWTNAFQQILTVVPGEDSTREGLVDTPRRAAKAMATFMQGYQQTAQEVVGDAIFQSDSNEMVLVRDIDVYSLCEHHMIPFFGKVHVAFLPRNGRVVGLSRVW
jgi:GTP cyclohydrolase I